MEVRNWIYNWISYAIITVLVVSLIQIFLTRVKTSKEARRRLQHAITGQLLVGISFILPHTACKLALLTGIVLVFYIFHFHQDFYRQEFGPLLRESEKGKLPGAFWFLIGVFSTAVCFDFEIVRFAVLCLSYSDPMAAWAGTTFKSPRVVGTASLAGCVACFGTSVLIGLLILESKWEIFLGSLVCTIAESFPFTNDNVMIPLLTASVVTIVRSSI